MISTKRFTRTVASALIVLMFMALIPFVTGSSVKASGVDKDHAKNISVHDVIELNADKTQTYLFHAPYTMKYSFKMELASYYQSTGEKQVSTITVYDSGEKKIASSNDMKVVVELTGGNDYYIVLDLDGKQCLFNCEYDYYIDFKAKAKGDSDYISMGFYTKWGSSVYDDHKWTLFEVVDSTDIKVDLKVNSLPSGMKLNYEWLYDKTDFNGWEKIGSANSTLILPKSAPTSCDTYKCLITSADGKFSDYILFQVRTSYTLTFADGKTWAYDAKAVRSGEDRTVKFPEVYSTDGVYKPKDYNFEEYYEMDWNYKVSSDPECKIPSTWRCPAIFSTARLYNTRVRYLALSFVIPEGAGTKVTSGNTYTIEGAYWDKDYDQAILSFTPEKSGTYRFTASNVTGYAICSIFDSDLKLVASSLGDYVSDLEKNIDDRTFDISANLTAGKTYYIAIPEILVTTKCDLTISEAAGLSFGDFVERLYVVALGRQSEKEGKDYWCELVGNGTLTGADCARFFLTSPEFKGRNLSDEDFLKVLYSTFFDRNAADDPDGFNFWMNSLKSVGKDTVVEGFINSPEWCNICADYGVRSGAPTAKATKASKNATAFATRLYTECLGREPEEGGLNYWSLGLTNCELTGSQAAHEFFYCQEFNDHGFSNEELITRMYKTFMGRNPDTEGLNYWLGNMNNGMTKDQVFNSFVQSQEFTEICATYAINRA